MAGLPEDLAPRPYAGPRRRIHTPSMLQMEAVECGAACLGMVLGYFGRHLSLEQLREACGVSRDGSKAGNIMRAGQNHGLEVKGFRKAANALPALKLPLIVFWQYRHFVVVEGFSSKKVYLNDPATGPRSVTWDEFRLAYSMVVLTFQPGPDFQKGGRPHRLLPSLAARLRGSAPGLVFAVLAGLLLVLPQIAAPTYHRIFVDQFLVGGLRAWVKPLLWLMLATGVMLGGLTWLKQRCLLNLETVKALEGSGQFLRHLLRLPARFFGQRYAGDLSIRVALNNKVANLLAGPLAKNALGLMTSAAFALLLTQYNPWLGLMVILVGLVNLAALKYVSRKRKELNLRVLMNHGRLMGVAMSGLSMMETIKASGAEDDFFARWADGQAAAINAQQEFGVYSRLLETVPPCLSQLNRAAVLGAGGWLVIQGQFTAGMLLAFLGLMQLFVTPLNNLVDLGGQLQEADGDMARLEDILHYPLDPAFAHDDDPLPPGPGKLSGRLELKNVTFGYSPLAPPLIEDFNLVLEPGQRKALVGLSGSGKSTVAGLVCGLHRPWKGQVLLDGKPMDRHPRPLITNSLASVDQSIMLFEGTVRDNLTLWDPTISDAELVAACKDACIHDEIASRPGGYGAWVAERGMNFSGGQRQRLEIARSLVQGATLQVLDEATANLDPVTERQIDQNLRRRGLTCLIVAHRLSTIRDCEEIIVLERGKVVQRGTHEQLKDQQGLYASLIHDD